MFKKLRQSWRNLTHGKPGERFQQRYHRNQRSSRGVARRWLVPIAGVLLFVVGVVLIPAPGPGLLVLIAGSALIAQESLVAARILDGAEVRVRGATRYWTRSSAPVKAVVATAGLLLLATLGYGVWLFLPGR